jgi:hypothetical protein
MDEAFYQEIPARQCDGKGTAYAPDADYGHAVHIHKVY